MRYEVSTFMPEGIMTALVTPFHADGSLNGEVISDLVEYQLSKGISGVAVTAGAGEYVNLRPEERVEVVRQAAEAIKDRVPLLAGILAPDTSASLEASLAAREAGARAILLLTPYYISPSPAGIIDHFRQVADAVDLPIVLYNNPGRTGINLELPVLKQLTQLPQVVGIKECDRDLGRVATKIKHLSEHIAFLGGDDDLSLPIWGIGARGSIMSGTNLFAPHAVACYSAVRDGNWEEARRIFYGKLLPLITSIGARTIQVLSKKQSDWLAFRLVTDERRCSRSPRSGEQR